MKRGSGFLWFRPMSSIALVAGVLAFVAVLAERAGTDGAVVQMPPDVSIAIAGADATAWQASAIGGHTVAGTYSVANPKRYPGAGDPPPDLGAFTWDGSRLHVYPVVVFDPGIDARPDNAVVAVNSAGVAVGANELEHMSSGGLTDEDRAARFADGRTTFVNPERPGIGLGRATAVDSHGNIVGYTADGLGFYATSTMARTAVAGLTTAAFGAAVMPSAINDRGDIAGTSTTLRTFGNRFDAPNPFEPHVFLAHAGAAAQLAHDLGPVPHCQTPTVAGLSNAGTIAGMCTSDATSHAQVAWEWSGAFHVLAALPGDDAAQVNAVSPDGIVLGWSQRGDRKTAVFWRNRGVASISSLTTVTGGDAFEEALGANEDGWILVRGKRGATATDFLIVPRADAAAAARIAVIPAGPAPTTTDAPPPPEGPPATPAPVPSIARTLLAGATRASLPILWSGGSSSDGSVPMASDGTRLYLAVAQAVEAFDSRGRLLWKRAFPGASAIAVTGGTLVSRGPKSTIGIDAASGALRWSVAMPRAAASSSFAVGDGFVGTGSGDVLQILDVRNGRMRARAAGAGDCSLREAASSFACIQVHVDYTRWLTVYDAATGHAMVTLPDAPTEVTTIGSTFYAYAGGAIEIHPRRGTYDVLTFPVTEEPDPHAAFDGTDVVIGDGAVARRYRLDENPASQRPVAFPVGHSGYFTAGAGVVASFEAPGKPLTIVTFDPTGKPSAVAYADVRSGGLPNILIRQGLAFASTSGGVTVVDLARRRVLGTAALSCDVLEDAIVAGGVAAVGCQSGASHRVEGIDLGR